MSPDEIKKAFERAFPKAIDFPVYEYVPRSTEIDEIAIAAGYRLAGYRLERAVFTTKPKK